MKSALIALSLILAQPALASPAEPVRLQTVQYNGEKMSFMYLTGGGCEDHRSKVTVTSKVKQESGYKQVTLAVSITDHTVSGEEDNCRAIVTVKGIANLKKLAANELSKLSIDPKKDDVFVNVVLPQVEVSAR